MAPIERKSYEQACPVATSLDLIGDRWTLLILRELLGGPARFQELKSGLPGIATNLLTERLRRMESDGIVRRIDGSLYALTEAGAGIRTAIEELGIWARRVGRIAPAVHERSIRAIAVALQSILVRAGDRLPADQVVVELAVDDDLAEVVVGPKPSVVARSSVAPEARVGVSKAWMSDYLVGEADGDGVRHLSGDDGVTDKLKVALGV